MVKIHIRCIPEVNHLFWNKDYPFV
jgi:hypothetical protein